MAVVGAVELLRPQAIEGQAVVVVEQERQETQEPMGQMLLAALAVNLHSQDVPLLAILLLVKVDTVGRLLLPVLLEATQNTEVVEEQVLMQITEVHPSLVLAVVVVF